MHTLEKEKLSGLSLGAGKNMVTQLLVINLTIYIFLFFTLVIYKMEDVGEPRFYQDIIAYLRVPSNPALALARPWTLLTAMFTQIQVASIFSNMVWLWVFGSILQHLAGYLRIVPLYLFGGIVANIFFVLGMQFIPGFQALSAGGGYMGAAGSVMAIAIGVTVFAPGYRIFPLLAGGGIPLWIITTIYLALTLGTHFTTPGAVVYLPMLAGGAIAGGIYMQQWKKGNDWGRGYNKIAFRFSHMFHPPAQATIPAEMLKASAGEANGEAPYKKVGKVPEQRINEILEKISANGITSLTADEKETLLRASKTE